MTPSPRRTRETLCLGRVLDVAMNLADREGLNALTMRRLAARLGVEAMSLYHHVSGKDALLDLLVDRVIGEVDLPQSGDSWKEAMRRRALSAHAVLRAHPWAPLLLLSRLAVGPAMLRYIDATHGCLLQAGFSHATADHARNVLDSHVYGFTLQALHFPIPEGEYAVAAKDFLPQLPSERYPALRQLAEQVIAGDYDGRNTFEFGLELLLEGLERLRPQSL